MAEKPPFNGFRGFNTPNNTQVPDELFDQLMPDLSGAELKTVLYIVRRTFGFKKDSDNISISQLLNGIRTRDGRQLDRGTGLSKPTLLGALRSLTEQGVIVPERRRSSERGDEATTYRLRLISDVRPDPSTPSGENSEGNDSGTPVVKKFDQGGSKNFTTPVVKELDHPVVKKSAPQVTVTKKQSDKVVNDVTGNDHKSNSRKPDRPSAGKIPTINPRVLRGKYGLTDDQIGHVFRLVDKQVDVLGAVERNHGNYVKRAAESVRDGQGELLDLMLGDFKQAATAIAVGSRPAYFHAMYTETLEKRRAEDTLRSVPTPSPNTGPSAAVPQTIGDLFAQRQPARPAVAADETRTRMIADAEKRGVPVPEYIHGADIREVSRWWANLPAEVPTPKS